MFNLRFVVLTSRLLLVRVEEEGHVVQSRLLSVERARYLANWFGEQYGWDRVIV